MEKVRLLIYNIQKSKQKLARDEEFLLENIEPYVKNIILVSKRNIELEKKIIKDKVKILVAEGNIENNLDSYAYAINKLEEKERMTYDEIVCISDNLIGPMYSLKELFDKINTEHICFWGLNEQCPTPLNYLDYSGENLQREYLPSYFMVFGKKIIQEGILPEIMQELQGTENEPNSLIDYKEFAFTRALEQRGYLYQTYVDTKDISNIYYNALLLNPVEMLKKRNCPFFLKESFIGDYDTIISNTSGQVGYELMEYLKNETTYDTDMIWEDILQCGHQQDINHNLQLNYILDEYYSNSAKAQEILKTKKIVLVMHLYFMDLLEESFHYAQSMPECADVYITTNTIEKKIEVEKVFKNLNCGKVEVRVIENQGRDVSSLLVGVKDIIFDYDYVCFVHDKKSAQVIPGSIGKDFGYQCFENTLCSKEFVENVICTLYENDRLGMLSPTYPIHGNYFATNGHFDWGANYDNTRELYERLAMDIPISCDKSPVAPLGTMFWFKAPALKRLYDCDWQYEDFPKEPNGVDGTLLHAIERIYSYVVQQEGYYPAMLANKEFANIQLTNLTNFLQGINHTLEKHYGYCSYQQALYYIDYMGNTINEMQCKLEQNEQRINELIPQASLKWQIKRKMRQILHVKEKETDEEK